MNLEFRPCVVIPVYNQPHHISATLEEIHDFGYDCIVIDDGSTDTTSEVLQTSQAHFANVTVLTRTSNGGKGAALVDGFREAARREFTHALQIDADGQHRTDDIATFVNAARQHPRHLIAGTPVYDSSVPKARLLGRQLSRVLCWAQTRSLALSDPLLGFRMYPLQAVIEVLEQTQVARRMGIDLELGVRLIWQGLGVTNIPTAVIYPDNGISHFHYWRDNLALARLHVRLLMLSFWRVPLKSYPLSNKNDWSKTRERGSVLGLRFIFFLYRMLGRKLSAFLLYPISLYFLISSKQTRRASYSLQEKLNLSDRPLDRWLWCFQQIHQFSLSLVDKVAAWLGDIRKDELDFDNYDLLSSIRTGGRGVIFMSAHLGNIEVCRAISEMHPDVKINALMFTRHSQKFQRFLEEICGPGKLRIIHVDQMGSSLLTQLTDRLDRGEHIALLGDRVPPGSKNKTSSVPFLNAPADFPQGPMLLASLLKRPVFLLFCLRKKDGRFGVFIEKFADQIEIPRASRAKTLQHWIQRFAMRLEHHLKLAPTQWFNFFPFWAADETLEKQTDKPQHSPPLPISN